METMNDWRARAPGWLDGDLALLTSDEGWTSCRAPAGVGLWRRKSEDDPNDLFRWRLAEVDAPVERVFQDFVTDILEHHAQWTKEFAGGRVVESFEDGARVIYQRFEPGLPGITPRDLCSLEVTRRLPDGAVLTSFRSVDGVPSQPGNVRIDWWGAALLRPTGAGKTEFVYLDRENQGGRVPAWGMNLAMPKYLVDQAVAVRGFFARAR